MAKVALKKMDWICHGYKCIFRRSDANLCFHSSWGACCNEGIFGQCSRSQWREKASNVPGGDAELKFWRINVPCTTSNPCESHHPYHGWIELVCAANHCICLKCKILANIDLKRLNQAKIIKKSMIFIFLAQFLIWPYDVNMSID